MSRSSPLLRSHDEKGVARPAAIRSMRLGEANASSSVHSSSWSPSGDPALSAADMEDVARMDTIENDEVIAHALQEELAQVTMAWASGADGEPRATVFA